jgi:O-methyltransferase domain
MEHDFLTTQPVKGAEIYLFRWIFHDWSDKYCTKILQSLIPALKKGAKIIINDICIPQSGQLGISADRSLR